MNLLKTEIKKLPQKGVLGGDVAFKLYDTYGFPLDLTMDISKESGISVDENGFNECMEEQRNRANWKNVAYDKSDEAVFFEIKDEIKNQEFVGYDSLSCGGKIKAIVVGGKRVDRLDENVDAAIVTDATPFYAECGGQVGDVGEIRKPLGIFSVTNTRKIGGVIVHEGHLEKGIFSVGENVTLSVNSEKRKDTQAHHTATHLLQAALRFHYGSQIAQKGSFVCPDYLRFDFCNPTGIDENLVEKTVNEWAQACLPVQKNVMDKDEAVKAGATALFGEKYDQQVRVVTVCGSGGTDGKPEVVSKELCGGTHVSNTGAIGNFKIISESSIGAGLRRIEAVSGNALLRYVNQKLGVLDALSERLKSTTHEMCLDKVQSILDDSKILENRLASIQQKLALAAAENAENVNGVNLIICKLDDASAKDLRPVADTLGKKYPSSLVVLFALSKGAIFSVVRCGDPRISARDALNAILRPLGGKGGGSDDIAQGGATSSENLENACSELRKFLQKL